MESQPEKQPEEETVAEETVEEEPVEEQVKESFTLERGKEQAAEAVDRVRQAGTDFSKEITTQPLLDAVGSYFTRGIDALISLAEGLEGKSKKDRE